MSRMKLSIIIPTYNEEKYLPGLFETIRQQTFRDYEIIVADNNSLDQTRAIAHQYGAKVVLGGLPAVARNKGAAAANGEFFLFLDADVLLPHPRFIEQNLAYFIEKNLGLAAGLPAALSTKKIDLIFHAIYNVWIKLLKKIFPHAGGFCILVRREVHQKINGFNEAICLAEDHDYAYRASRVANFGLLPVKIFMSVRRFERDGRFNIACKYAVCELYLLAGGKVNKNIFKYGFGYDEK